jgi:hypothetical protein
MPELLTCVIDAVAAVRGVDLDREALAAAVEQALAELVEGVPRPLPRPRPFALLPDLTVVLPEVRDTGSIGRAIAEAIYRSYAAGGQP